MNNKLSHIAASTRYGKLMNKQAYILFIIMLLIMTLIDVVFALTLYFLLEYIQ